MPHAACRMPLKRKLWGAVGLAAVCVSVTACFGADETYGGTIDWTSTPTPSSSVSVESDGLSPPVGVQVTAELINNQRPENVRFVFQAYIDGLGNTIGDYVLGQWFTGYMLVPGNQSVSYAPNPQRLIAGEYLETTEATDCEYQDFSFCATEASAPDQSVVVVT